jgi:2-dehydro-3-deoxygalactonokinase
MTNHTSARLIALDWGTSSCRAYLLGEDGCVLTERRQDSGSMVVATAAEAAGTDHASAFEESFEALCGDWLTAWPGIPVIACGMVGSNHGWVETPYRRLPADLAVERVSLTSVTTRRGILVHIIPGLISDLNLPDVLRGEETQVLGALMGDPDRGHGDEEITRVVLLPGTHSKWVRVTGHTVTHFMTFMTGEFFSLLTTESSLSLLSSPAIEVDWDAFDRALDVAATRANGGILTTVFSARTLVMTGQLAPTQVEDYLSGLLIGAEIAGVRAAWLGHHPLPILLCGEAGLNERYRRALKKFGLTVARESTTSAVAGMWHTAVAAGLLPDTSPPASSTSPHYPSKSRV